VGKQTFRTLQHKAPSHLILLEISPGVPSRERTGTTERRSAHTEILPTTALGYAPARGAVPQTNLGGFQFSMGVCHQAEKPQTHL